MPFELNMSEQIPLRSDSEIMISLPEFTRSLHLEDLKQRRFKPLQKVAYQCMAKCCDSDGSQKALQDCFAKCGGPLEQATQLYQAETQRFQQKIQRCASSCQDEAQVC